MKNPLRHKMFLKLQIIAALFLFSLGSGGSIFAQVNTIAARDNTNIKPVPVITPTATAPVIVIPNSLSDKKETTIATSKQEQIQEEPQSPLGSRSIYDEKWQKGGKYEKYNPEQEIIAKRDANSKHFQNADGSTTVIISSGVIHYKDEYSRWMDIRTDIRQNTSGTKIEYYYAITENKYNIYFPQSLDDGYLIDFPGGDIQLGMKGEVRLLSGEGDVLKSVHSNAVNGIVADNIMKFNATYPFGYDELNVRRMGIDHDIILTEKPAFLDEFDNGTNVAFREFVKLPKGWRIETKSEAECPGCGNAESDEGLFVIDASGNIMVEFITPIAVEQNVREIQHNDLLKGEYTEFKQEGTNGEYRIEIADGGIYIETCIPASWLNDPDRIYPVIIDPTATCYIYSSPADATSSGYGISSANCYCGYSVCGDQVRAKGGNVERGWMFFDITGIPDGSTITNTTWTAYCYARNAPYFDIRNMSQRTFACATYWADCAGGTLFYNTTSSPVVGWNTYTLLAAANTRLQALLPSNWFGTGIYDYDASSTYYCYWYGYSGANDPYVAVTYSAPNPCSEAINIPSAPVTNQSLVCTGAALPGNLNATNVPTACGAASNSYKGGQEALYTFTPTSTGLYTISYSGQTWSAIFVYSGACPASGGTCVGSVGSSASTESIDVNLTSGTLYYIWFDTWPSPNSPCAGTFSIALPCSAPAAPTTCFSSIGTPANGTEHRINLSCAAVTGADGYDFDYSYDGATYNDLYEGTSNSININYGDQPNIKCYHRARAYKCTPKQYSGWTYSSPNPIYTACDVPASPTVNTPTATTLNVTINAESPVANPAITTYSIYCTTTAQYVQAGGTLGAGEVFQTKAVWGTKTVTGLTCATTYTFYAKARNNDGDVRFNAANTGSNTTSACGCIAGTQYGSATAPTDNVEILIAGCTYAGEYNNVLSVVSGQTYQFRSSNASDFLTLTNTSNSILTYGTTPISWTASFSGDVRLHVHTNSSCGTAAVCRDTYIQCTSCSSCTTPGTPGTLSTSSITSTGATFNWAAGSPVGSPTVTYYWAVGPLSTVTYEAGYTARGTTTGLTASTSVLSCGQTRYWTVKSCTNCGAGSCSAYPAAISFSTTACPGSVTLNNPFDNYRKTYNIVLEWSASPANRYWLEVDDNYNFSSMVINNNNVTSPYTISAGLTDTYTYYWRVAASNDNGTTWGSWSDIRSFTYQSGQTDADWYQNCQGGTGVTQFKEGSSGGTNPPVIDVDATAPNPPDNGLIRLP